ncbi:MAG TPA: hypothetical protein VER98_02580 [Terriglobia bacterium]|nr:hypothetical protein [Terriglobia bacterium]
MKTRRSQIKNFQCFLDLIDGHYRTFWLCTFFGNKEQNCPWMHVHRIRPNDAFCHREIKYLLQIPPQMIDHRECHVLSVIEKLLHLVAC